jgi:hypothetical protein
MGLAGFRPVAINAGNGLQWRVIPGIFVAATPAPVSCSRCLDIGAAQHKKLNKINTLCYSDSLIPAP